MDVNLIELADKLFKIGKEGVETAQNELGEGFDPISFIESNYIKTLETVKADAIKPFEQRIGRSVRETAEKKDKEVFEKLGIEYNGQKGEDYYNAIKEHFTKSDQNEEFTSLKEKYNSAIKEKSELLKSFETDKEKAINEIVSQYETKERANKIKDYASSNFLSRKDLSWSGDKDVDQFRAGLFKDQLSKLNTKFNEDGTIDLLDDNGELLKNEKHHVIAFDQVAEDILRKTIGISKQTAKQSTGVAPSTTFTSNSPKDLKSFNEAYNAESDPEKRQEMFKSFKEQNK